MTLRALLGLALLNAFLVGVGLALLHGISGKSARSELARLSGVAYLLGVAAIGVASVLELVVGLHLSPATILLTGTVLGAAAIVIGSRRERRRTPHRGSGLSFATASFAALAIVYLEALFRSGRLRGLYEFDAWAFWVPKAKAIYFFGGLDPQFFRDLPGPSYPPLLPALEAAAFHFMGSADVVTLHLQFWFLLAGFVAAVAGLLAPRVPPSLLWPPLLLVLAAPYVVERALQPQADFLLDELVAVAALLLALWVVEEEPWTLVAAALLLAAAMLTKREGYPLAACVLAAVLAASVGRRPRAVAPVVVAAAAAVAVTVPWRVFLAARGLSGGGPEAGGTGLFAHLDRAWPSARLAASALFDFGEWLLAVPVAVAATVLAAVAGSRRLSLFGATLYVAMFGVFTWTTWAFPSLPITKDASLNPIVRFTGSAIVLTAALTPLLLASAWGSRADGNR